MNHLLKIACAAGVVSLSASTVVTGQNFFMPSHVIGSGAANGTSTNFKLLGTVGQSAIGTGTSTNFKGSWGFWYTLGAGGSVIFADVEAFLEGPYSGSAMTSSIRSVIPTSQPFSGSPWNYLGSESVSGTDTSPANGTPDFFDTNNTIVDWVYVELRTGNPASPPMAIVGQRAGFIKTDGSIVDIDGASALSFPGLPAGSYYVVVDHRNHVDAMSATAIASSSGTVSHDFRSSLASAYTGGSAAMKSLGSGKYGLFAADPTADGEVTVADFNVWNPATTAGSTGYILADFNLELNATVADFNYWNANTTAGASSQVPAAVK